MAVNESVYSQKSNWRNYRPTLDTSIDYEIRIPSYSAIKTGISQGFIPLNQQLDLSITTVQTDKNFSGGIVNFARGSGVDNFDLKYINRDIYGEFEYKNIALFGCGDINYTSIRIHTFDQFIIAPTYTATNNRTDTKPIVSFNNKRIKLLIAIHHNSTNSYNGLRLTDLETFINSGNKYVFGVYAIPLLGDQNNVYRMFSSIYYFSMTYNVLNYPTKIFPWYINTELSRNSKFYSLLEKNYFPLNFDYPHSTTQENTSQLFPIFSQFGISGDLRCLYGTHNTIYYPSVGEIPDFTNSELELNGKITKNGITLEKTQSTDNLVNLSRYIDLNATDYWGDDYTKFIEWCKKQTAYFGMFFITSYDDKDKSLTDSNTYLGMIDDDGVTHGEYTHGIENSTQKNFSGDIISDIEKKPPDKIQKDKGDLTSNINPFRYKSPNQLFILNETDLNDLFTFINIGYRPNEENFILDFKGKNPIDYIVSVNVFPFDIPTYGPVEVDLSIGGIPVKKSPFLETAETVKVKQLGLASEFVQPIFDFGTVSINPYFNDFRDFEPFTRCEIQLPYCGTYTVDLKKFMNKNLSVKYVVDYNTGACTALIFMNDLLIDTVDGQIGFSIPLSGIAQGEYQNTIQRNSYNAKIAGYDIVKSGINQVSNVLTGNLKGSANSTINSLSAIETGLQANYELTHTAPQPTILSTADTLNSFCQDNRARVLFYRCEIPRYDEEIFKKTVGYACIKSGKVSDFTGLMICSNVKLDNINCTDTEKNILKNLLTSGIYN